MAGYVAVEMRPGIRKNELRTARPPLAESCILRIEKSLGAPLTQWLFALMQSLYENPASSTEPCWVFGDFFKSVVFI